MQRNAFWGAQGEAGGMRRRRQLELSCMNNVREGCRSRWAECINFSAPKLQRISSTNASGSPFSALTLNLVFPFIFFPRIPKRWRCFLVTAFHMGWVYLCRHCAQNIMSLYTTYLGAEAGPLEKPYISEKNGEMSKKSVFLGEVDCP